jgi:RHS repeat-associated protein
VGSLLYTDPKHPHAVTNAGGAYAYDAVGNQVMRPGGVSIAYTSFDLPKTTTQDAKSVSLGYDADQQRIRKTTSTSEALYFGDLFEQITTGAIKEYRYYVQSPERTIAIVTRGGNEPGTKYLHTDHLGSTETITNELGVQVEKRSYDAYGGRRNSIWGTSGGVIPSKTKHGFTGHDEEDEFGLVNMKGRLYDPHIARFTTTDPVIANVFDGQTLNAYAYVGNNPLAFIDPTGFTGEGVVQQSGFPDVPLPVDVVQPSESYLAAQEDRRQAAQKSEPGANAPAPKSDMDTMGGDDDVVVLPIIETDHPGGPGTDDPFGVYPTDIELGYAEPITVFDELVAGDPAGGRRTFIIKDDLGIGRDIRLVFGVERQTVILRPRIGGEAGDDKSRAKQDLLFEGILTLATVLTPGPLDDIAAAGLRGSARAGTYGELRALAIRDGHHVIQDAAVRDLPGYSRARAPAVELPGPSTRSNTPHWAATVVQRQRGGGTFAAERRIGYKALRRAGMSAEEARIEIYRADAYFRSIGVQPSTPTRIPGNR